MTFLFLFLATAIVFLVIDAIALTTVMKPLFTRHLGDAMRDSPMMAPAAVFYTAYALALVWLVSMPALRADAPMQALVQGAVVGFMAYGTFEFTSMSIMRNWSWTMVATDTIWRTVLTGVSAWAGVVIVRALA
ncbi:DUF2177 family protein [Palleronia sediminis]|uniref:DUF2177 family protein n=1 Tax=Palleronia sediminis TaxID=2547833 RepID=A0A4R6AEX3_9RHOB|nr:DUF2177 family protein [Palleronia sediminis]TDL81827.1 DUF2177 family protein [Palleronia sediminis]